LWDILGQLSNEFNQLNSNYQFSVIDVMLVINNHIFNQITKFIVAKQTFRELIEGDVPVLVDFYADWCAPCRMMAPVLEEFKTEMGDKVKVIKINVDHNQGISQALNIGSIPTLIIFKNGEAKWRHSGLVQLGQLRNALGGIA